MSLGRKIKLIFLQVIYGDNIQHFLKWMLQNPDSQQKNIWIIQPIYSKITSHLKENVVQWKKPTLGPAIHWN